jgi:hypothetical protein
LRDSGIGDSGILGFRNSGIGGFWDFSIPEFQNSQFLNSLIPQFAIPEFQNSEFPNSPIPQSQNSEFQNSSIDLANPAKRCHYF